MMDMTVAHVSLLVRSAVNILSASFFATRRVLLVLNNVHGPASTKGLAPCHVLLPATDYRATSAVPGNFRVVTSARDFAVRLAPKNTATNVP